MHISISTLVDLVVAGVVAQLMFNWGRRYERRLIEAEKVKTDEGSDMRDRF